jgi:hypothetical protein
MMQSTRKCKIISLRLSDEEFESLRTLYVLHGARSVSEFIRNAMQRVIAEPPDGNLSLEVRVQQMDGRLTLLDSEVARLSRMLSEESTLRLRGCHESD